METALPPIIVGAFVGTAFALAGFKNITHAAIHIERRPRILTL
jgi:hypothetical protein